MQLSMTANDNRPGDRSKSPNAVGTAKTAPRFYAQKCAQAIVAGLEERPAGVKWLSNTSVRIVPSQVVPTESAARQTIIGRRKRFRQIIGEVMTSQGWRNESRPRSPFLEFSKL